MSSSRAAENFRRYLEREMEERQLSQSQIAEMSGVYQSNLSALLAGKRGLSFDTAERIAVALDLPLETMIADPSRQQASAR